MRAASENMALAIPPNIAATLPTRVQELLGYSIYQPFIGYVDGVKWFEDSDPTHQPPGSMHQTLQLDWFPDGTPNGHGEMRVDWVRVYAQGTPST